MPHASNHPARHVVALIPTHARPDKAAACASTLARQSHPAEAFTVLFALDGDDPTTRAEIQSAWTQAAGRAASLIVHACPRAGYNAARNHGLTYLREHHPNLALDRTTLLLSLNDDILADPDLIAAHVRAHNQAARLGHRGVIISGSAPWVVPTVDQDSLTDRLVRETSMVFFYDQMSREKHPDPYRDWGFRHCYGLNFSAPLWAVIETCGFTAFPFTYGHDDIELAFRLNARFAFPVWFRPDARVRHDHRYRAQRLLDREFNLGVASWRFAQALPAFGRALFNRDVTSPEEIEYSRQFLQREALAAERLRRTFLSFDQLPAASIPPSDTPAARTLIEALYQQHLLLKRWTWRKGLLEAAASPTPALNLPS
ncbi:MAG: glycosyltransferase [Phycisphaeraceae bacterium]|nr:glycosyltransferase [Phycisphaeraceae bacterium]